MNSKDFLALADEVRKMSAEVAAPAMEVLDEDYQAPSLRLLKNGDGRSSKSTLDAAILEDKLEEFGFKSEVEHVRKGPMITRYEMRLASGVRLSQVKKVADDLAIALMSDRIRIQAPIPGTSLIGVEVANEEMSTVGMRDVIKAVREFKGELPIAVGVDIVGTPKIIDLAKMPHLLIAGQTGSGKSVGLNGIILSILYTKTPDECKLVLVDPKRVEMASYADVPHLLRPTVTEPEDAVQVFADLVTEMEQRYAIFESAGVRNIVSYREQGGEMPYIVAVVDELADLMMTAPKDMEKSIVRLAQLARAVGIHLVLATQKPIVKVITGLIKSNMTSRISYQVTTNSDSRVILDTGGAEKLLGRGDLLLSCPGITEPERYHGAWVSDQEIAAVCSFLKGE